MGTNSKAAHTSYEIAPATPTAAKPLGALAQPDDGEALQAATNAVELVEGLALNGVDPDDPYAPPTVDAPLDVHQRYAILTSAVQEAQGAIAALTDTTVADNLQAKLALQCQILLADSTHNQLVDLAAAQGFEYPWLVGFAPGENKPLIDWLNPATPAEDEAKKKIQAVALDRYAALCAGKTVGGKTLAQWQHEFPTPTTTATPTGFTSWYATAADLTDAQKSLATAILQVKTATAAGASDDYPDAVAAIIAAENKIATARNPALDQEIAQAVAAARHDTDQVLTFVPLGVLGPAITTATTKGEISATAPQTLNYVQILKLLRASTPAQERTDLETLAAARQATLTECTAKVADVTGQLGHWQNQLPSLADPAAATSIADLITNTHHVKATEIDMTTWDTIDVPKWKGSLTVTKTLAADWAHEQNLGTLRAFATDSGLLTAEQSSVATKSELATYLYNYTAGRAAVAKSLSAKLQHKYSAKHTAPSSPSSVPAPAVVTAPPKSSFGAQHQQMVAALRQAQATYAAVPQALDPATVSTWDFGTGQPAHLGGTHPKTLHTGPDGKTWLAKREATPYSGAGTEAEAAASKMLARAGLPAVPVYATKINGKPVSVQPMLTGATEMSSSPSSWSQADVDAVVRLHVASWALANHDAHPGNVLRTSDGGLVPIDQGQSFKYYGKDRLAVGYRHPPPVYDLLYTAQLKGTLPKGVRVNPGAAHAVIKTLESVPDAEWRAMLHTAAYAGAAQPNLTWVPRMRARAAKQHGIAETVVSTSQIAEAFLDHAVERKNNLRRDFTKFFTDELKMSSAAALEHLGKR